MFHIAFSILLVSTFRYFSKLLVQSANQLTGLRQEAQEGTAEAFSEQERGQRVELLDIMLKVFGYGCILGHCKCLIFGYFACGDKERAKFMIDQYLHYVEEYKKLNSAE